MKKFIQLLFLFGISFNMLHAYTALEDLLLSKSHPIAGTFGAYDFADKPDAFDWAFTTAMGTSYQLQGKAPSDKDVFGWKKVTITAPKAAWAMFPLDVEGDGEIGKFDWILVGSNSNAVYKLNDVSPVGTFEYSDRIDLHYTIANGAVTFSAEKIVTPLNTDTSLTPTKATSIAQTTVALIGTTTPIVKSLSSLATLAGAPELRTRHALKTATTKPCSGGGSMSTDIDYNELAEGILNVTIDYNNCSEGILTQNGLLKLQGNIDLKTYAVSNLVATLKDLSFNVGNESSTSTGTIIFTSISTTRLDMTLNLKINATIDGKSVRFDYNDYTLVVEGNSVEINGAVTVDYTPDSCIDGTYTIVTVTPITITDDGEIVSGSITVNSQRYTFNADGTISTVINGETVTIDPSDELEMCS